MNPLIATIIARTLAGAAAAATVPTAMNMEPSAPIPATMDEAIVQLITALIVVGGMYVKKVQSKKSGK